MKNTIVLTIILLALCVSVSASTVLTGSSNTSYGDYKIVKNEQLTVIDNVAYLSWTLNYQGMDKKFTVLYSPGINGQCCFTIRNADFEIIYANVNGKFGARLVEPGKRTISKWKVMQQMNMEQFMMQEVLTSSPKTEEEYLGLVACFLPLLLA
jgi:hypothetical protein